jgi:hypothetical protein
LASCACPRPTSARTIATLFIEELAANIEAKGLLQNLIVAPAKKRGMFDVTAGGRRLRALNFLLEAGKLAKDHPVACRVLDIDAAEQSELSLIENVIRLDIDFQPTRFGPTSTSSMKAATSMRSPSGLAAPAGSSRPPAPRRPG